MRDAHAIDDEDSESLGDDTENRSGSRIAVGVNRPYNVKSQTDLRSPTLRLQPPSILVTQDDLRKPSGDRAI